MKTLVLTNPGHFTLEDRPLPTTSTDIPLGYAAVRPRRAGVCGTDWHAFHGRQPFFSYPRVLGHELGVEVEAVNDPTSSIKPGDLCSVEPYLHCGACLPCRRGKTNCCTSLKVLGVHIDGGFCERLILPTSKLHSSNKLTLDQLALVETLAIGSHAVSRAAPEPNENVLILGAGPIGLSVIPFVRVAGARAIVADISHSRLAFAADRMGAAATFSADANLANNLQHFLGGDLPTLVIDATGNPASMARTFELAAHSAKIVFVGLFQGDLTFNDPNFHRRELTLLASRNALPEDFKKIITMIENRHLDTTPWITHRSKLQDFPAQIPTWLKPESQLLKAILEI